MSGSLPCTRPADLYPLPDLCSLTSPYIAENEVALYDDWRQLGGRTLHGPDGPYEVIDPGKLNSGPGPDFLSGLVLFPDGEVRRGDIEIHLERSGWRGHGHHVDPRYSEVIVHVVLGGSSRSVRSVSGDIPTLFLPPRPLVEMKPCQVERFALRTLPDSDLNSFLESLARQRWYGRLKQFDYSDWADDLNLLAKRLGPGMGASRIVEEWRRHLRTSEGLESFLEHVGCGRNVSPLNPGEKTVNRRYRFLSAVVFKAFVEEGFQGDAIWGKMQSLWTDLLESGYDLPNRNYSIEIVGNWLLPWLTKRSGLDMFGQWAALPIGWRYSRVSQMITKLGVARPRTFGEQQGWIEWERSLCDRILCEACPVSG